MYFGAAKLINVCFFKVLMSPSRPYEGASATIFIQKLVTNLGKNLGHKIKLQNFDPISHSNDVLRVQFCQINSSKKISSFSFNDFNAKSMNWTSE